MQGMRAVLVMNKCDLGEDAAQQARRDYAGAELPVLCVSAGTGAGVEQLRAQMPRAKLPALPGSRAWAKARC